jgi:hypothetical protein
VCCTWFEWPGGRITQHTKKMCIKLYFFKEIWSSSCIDGHDLYIISNVCLHRNCQVVSLQTFKTHFTLLISLEFLVVLSYHLVTQIMYNTLCFINGTLDPFKGDVMNVMTQLFWPKGSSVPLIKQSVLYMIWVTRW